MAHDDLTRSRAMEEYVNEPNKPVREIAAKYGVSKGTLTVWALDGHIKLRGRGRDKQAEPNMRTRRILERASVMTQGEAGEKFGVTKQRVSKLMRRWKNWQKPTIPPFAKGDIIEWQNRKFTILEAEVFFGKVQDNKSGEIIHNFYWTAGNHESRKVPPEGKPHPNPNGKSQSKPSGKAKGKQHVHSRR